MVKKILLGLFLLISVPMAIKINVVQKAIAQQENALWIDVRSPAEWEQGHLNNAILIPYDVISEKIRTVAKNKAQPINLYCRSGRRAEIALRTLEQMGYTNVQNLGSYSRLR